MGSTRTPTSHSQRVALRNYYQSSNPKPTQSALRAWFKSQFGHNISQSIVSRTLSDSFAHLDYGVKSASEYRLRKCQWPWLETLLTNWLEEAEAAKKEVSNTAIGNKARQLWAQSEESQGLAAPAFSAGWVTKFRRRHDARLQSSNIGQRLKLIKNAEPALLDRLAFTYAYERFSGTSLESKQLLTCHIPDSTFYSEIYLTIRTKKPSLSHLPHLIQLNTFQALMFNKNLVVGGTIALEVTSGALSIRQFPSQLCGGIQALRPAGDRSLPVSLNPTPLQMDCPHSHWIAMFPFPKFRDNLIKKGEDFVPEEMCWDLFSDLFPSHLNSKDATEGPARLFRDKCSAGRQSTSSHNQVIEKVIEDEDDYTAGRRSLLIWGDPWDIGNWEITPTFLNRWKWALEGCDDLIYASNRWRRLRHEEALRWP